MFTSDLHNAGTHAQIYLTVYGEKGNSGLQPLGTADAESDQTERGRRAEFDVSVKDDK